METNFISQTPSQPEATVDNYVANPLLSSPEADRFAAHCLLQVDAFLAEQAAAAAKMQPA
ncbi:hypothetical protein ACFPAF_16535 [Hymenobacter endophyticus]|uniref:Uncharacterized protein n=1 Tax=Hymenobacter endophyticus TaxID=3076335 RepID=A0ABU3TL05_9BACT|nr:hypothetical protein [Hymenobacter endophyticus]MDU0372012.1 hypothetical protein [Hymenobacter endophyticus]